MTSHPRRGRRSTVVLVLLLAISLLAAACGGNDDNKSDNASKDNGSDSSGSSSDDPVAYGKAQLEKWYKGTERAMPDSAPAIAKGKKVWVISCGQAAEGCAVPGNAAIDAGKLVGWDMTIFDGGLNPSKYSDGVRQAIAAHADGIILDVVDCAITKQALQEAKDAGIKLLGLHALDCSDPTAGSGKNLWDADLYYGEQFPNYKALVLAFGSTKADWIMANAGAKANIIEFRQDELAVVKYINDGFDKEIKAHCPDCKITTVNFVLADLGPKVTAKAQAALAQNPSANAIMVPYDSALTFGIGSAIDSSGRKSQLKVMGGEGFKSNIEAARKGKQQDAGTGYGFEWEGWATIDSMNRLFNGQDQVDCGCGFKVWDVGPPAHNLPPEGQAYQPTADFRTNYKKIWKIGT